ncbi:ABC transporter ATP-binding protein [Actinophytocola algeriensis]|jgi:branched-chain amino acid transport system ATP-binding protein|uniref:Branched-chain amino acid transport system ATP-binding protein n=1 Tax=Actinophytocola algeriensis TaxID=1768010 RepID=A0A7W7VHG3_9PSEU|nr:ABC transporter ATP-binding protein [Actinophytocola algeriensis]MBB4910482.1 branched-chain amino acid transport system ATP-binding protein [Actinophytocola algeriensis]MBE1480529.1 branched-chain amino acid transport system ATP-binding protein [Actinophytocola algeriensis]
MTLLSVDGVTKRFGGLAAVSDVSFEVPEGTITGLIGPNGAGKSTLFSMIAGAQRPTAGRISFAGKDITGWQPHEAARAGVGRTFQLMRVFGSMTVLENLTTAAHLRHRTKASARAVAERVCAETNLGSYAHRPAATLTGATKKRLELARALATSPRLLLLDEVLSGLTPTETAEAISLIEQVHAQGITIVLVEHVMQVVMSLCPRLVVLDFGKLIFTGSPDDAVKDQAVLDAYLGA